MYFLSPNVLSALSNNDEVKREYILNVFLNVSRKGDADEDFFFRSLFNMKKSTFYSTIIDCMVFSSSYPFTNDYKDCFNSEFEENYLGESIVEFQLSEFFSIEFILEGVGKDYIAIDVKINNSTFHLHGEDYLSTKTFIENMSTAYFLNIQKG